MELIVSNICDAIKINPKIAEFGICEILKASCSFVYSEVKTSLLVLETVVKYCRPIVQEEIVKESNCEIFAKLIITTPYNDIRDKMMSLIQMWAFIFKNPDRQYAVEVSYFNLEALKLVKLKVKGQLQSSNVIYSK